MQDTQNKCAALTLQLIYRTDTTKLAVSLPSTRNAQHTIQRKPRHVTCIFVRTLHIFYEINKQIRYIFTEHDL
jgi:hypothetical protein